MNFKKNNLILFSILIIFSIQLFGLAFLFFSPVKVDAQVNFTPQVTIPGSEFTKGGGKKISGLLIAEYVQAWYKFVIAGVGILAVVMIMAGGLIWLTAAGRAEQISMAKDWIMGAVVGLILALMGYTLLNILNPNLVTFESLDVPEIEFKDSGLCCFPESGQDLSMAKGGCVKKDKEGNVIENGTRCVFMQACVKVETSKDSHDKSSGFFGTVAEEKQYQSQYECKFVKEGTSCESFKDCPESWFCVDKECYNGSDGDPCEENKFCGNGLYCAKKQSGMFKDVNYKWLCFDGSEKDPCDNPSQCQEPMTCKAVWFDDKVGTRCHYDRSVGACLPNGVKCSDNDQCCGGDCDCAIIPGIAGCLCKNK